MIDGIRSIGDLAIEGRRTFVRVDFNVPLSDDRKVTDDTRIREALPTIKHAIGRGARVVLASHLGRPKGKRNPAYSMEPVGARLAEMLALDVIVPDDCIGDGARKVVADLRDGQIVLLENLRFHPEEEANDDTFCRELAKLCDVYVNDAFGAAHRAHASVAGLARLVPERGAGFLMEKELAALGRLRASTDKPYLAVLGGAKVSDKIAVIEALMARVDALLIGGAMANTFLAAQGLELGKSLVETDKLPLARTLLAHAREKGIDLLLPVDVVVAPAIDADTGKVVPVASIPADAMALDIGPATLAGFRDRLLKAKTVFWNGPMGLFEKAPFAEGTLGVARAIAETTAFSVVGGGDSVAAIAQAKLAERFTHVSTGGGASLELIEGKKLPGVEALRP